jgi:dihydrolipoamide dehydrogenase
VLVDREPRPGGVCLHSGCMPSKALLSVADLAFRARNAAQMGLSIPQVEVDMQGIRRWQQGIVDGLARGIETLLAKHKVTYVQGDAILASNREVAISTSGGSELYLARRGILIATGATRGCATPIPIDGVRVLNAADALRLERLPCRVAVVGADYIAVEMAVAFRKLGAEVVLLGADMAMLPEIDPALLPIALRGLRKLGIDWQPHGIPLEMRDEGLAIECSGEHAVIQADVVIVSGADRTPNTRELGLDLMPLRTDDVGFLITDAQQRTSEPGIFAIGDVTAGPAWAHRAHRQGKVAAEVIAGKPSAFDNIALPAVVLCEPELASVGYSEEQARQAGFDVVACSVPWAANGRALTLGNRDGVTRLVFERSTGVVLGVHVAGMHAGELIAEAALALEMAATVEDIAATIHPHPRLCEGLVEAADLAMNLPTHALPSTLP